MVTNNCEIVCGSWIEFSAPLFIWSVQLGYIILMMLVFCSISSTTKFQRISVSDVVDWHE